MGVQRFIWQFQYQRGWLDTPGAYPLCPSMPLQAEPIEDGGSQRPVQWYFDNLLPEEGQRQLLARDARIDAADAFGLLGYYGAESAGSLTLLPPEVTSPAPRRLVALSDADSTSRDGPTGPNWLGRSWESDTSSMSATRCFWRQGDHWASTPRRPGACWKCRGSGSWMRRAG